MADIEPATAALPEGRLWPVDGDFVQVVGGNVHIALVMREEDPARLVRVACGRNYDAVTQRIKPGDGDWPRQCAACWEVF